MCRWFWSCLGLTRSHDHSEGDACPKSKMATSKVTSFQVYVTNIHNYCWNMPNPCQIKCFRMLINVLLFGSSGAAKSAVLLRGRHFSAMLVLTLCRKLALVSLIVVKMSSNKYCLHKRHCSTKIFSQFYCILSCSAVGELQSWQRKCMILADFRQFLILTLCRKLGILLTYIGLNEFK